MEKIFSPIEVVRYKPTHLDKQAAAGNTAWATVHGNEDDDIGVLETDFDMYPEQLTEVPVVPVSESPFTMFHINEMAKEQFGVSEVPKSLLSMLRPNSLDIEDRVINRNQKICIITKHEHLVDIVEAPALVRLPLGNESALTADRFVIPMNKAMAFETYKGQSLPRVVSKFGHVVFVRPRTGSVENYAIPKEALQTYGRLGSHAITSFLKMPVGLVFCLAPYGTRLKNPQNPPEVGGDTLSLLNRFDGVLVVSITHAEGEPDVLVSKLLTKEILGEELGRVAMDVLNIAGRISKPKRKVNKVITVS